MSRKYDIERRSHKIIIPIAKDKADWENFSVQTGNPLSPLAKLKIREIFPFDLAFAMTVHKAQGRTIRRVVIDLRDHPRGVCRLKYAAMFVAMSRVEHSNHLRLLEPETVLHRSSYYEYLMWLKPHKDIAPFQHGYATFGSKWDYKWALTYSKRTKSQ